MTTIRPEDFDDFDEYCDALLRLPSRTPAQELALVEQSIAYGEEYQAEALTQYRSECALFGDAGPGQWKAAHDRSGLVALAAKADRLRRICANLGQ